MRALHTDRYQIAMLLGYLRAGMGGRRAACELFLRRLPASRPFLVVAGIERAVRAALDLRFTADDVRWLREQPALREAVTPEVERYLRDFRFRGAVHAMPEGTVAFAGEPLLRVEAALPEAQLLETILLSILNHDARVATKAARVVTAASGRPCFEFGSRRTHEEAAVDAARAAFVGGFAGTSNEEAGRRHGVPVSGTCAHMWILAFAEEGEEEAFRAYARAFPGGATYLVDTYDTARGIDRAIAAAGSSLLGVRIDSGDLGALARMARAKLDAAGLRAAKVVLSGDLDEYKIARLLSSGAPADTFGVGTDVVATPDAPSLGGVYKLVAVEGASGRWLPVAKRSEGKATYPGRKQVLRRREGGAIAGDEIVLEEEVAGDAPAGREALLVPYARDGALVGPLPSLPEARDRSLAQVRALPAALREIPASPPSKDAPPVPFPVARSPASLALLEAALAK